MPRRKHIGTKRDERRWSWDGHVRYWRLVREQPRGYVARELCARSCAGPCKGPEVGTGERGALAADAVRQVMGVMGDVSQPTRGLGQRPAFLPVPGSRLASPFPVLLLQGHTSLCAQSSPPGSLSSPVPRLSILSRDAAHPAPPLGTLPMPRLRPGSEKVPNKKTRKKK